MSSIKGQEKSSLGATRRQQTQSKNSPSSIGTPDNRPHAEPSLRRLSNGQSNIETDNANSKLVFGLSSHTNRLKHDEYAESRRLRSEYNQIQMATQPIKTNSQLTKSLTNNANQKQQPAVEFSSSNKSDPGQQLKIRASKYGNFYKPQDLNSTKEDSQDLTRATTTSNTRKKSPSRLPKEGQQVNAQLQQNKPKLINETQQPALSSEPEATSSLETKGQEPKRMQFNIPPPPKVNSKSLGRSSVVSYAKSRIYDKPVRQILSNPVGSDSLLELQGGGEIPKSILSGIKPPKQVNVTKAREKWEGGEIFAKCKSRQRLAAQAGKKFLHGTWSMTSVVATQQLQLQQALAASSNGRTSTSNLSGPNSSDSPVKVLARGAVLERVQQFEKSPSASSLTNSTSGGSLNSGTSETITSISASSSSSSISSLLDDNSPEEVDNEASIIISKAIQQSRIETPCESSRRQVQYKNQVSSLQDTNSNESVIGQQSLGSPRSLGNKPFPNNNHLRRRSSTTTLGCANSNNSANIPKFYHPNGKPNTYEIEVQKKNIVACFDKFPEQKALLSGPNSRRHFHSIALACGFTEYFKEPLLNYVKHQLRNSNLLHSTSANQSMMSNLTRKTSVTSGPLVSGLPTIAAARQPAQKLRPLTKAASIDTSTMEKLANQNYVTCDQFLMCWLNMIQCSFDLASKFIHLLTLGQRQYLIPDDFVPLVQSVIEDHPGLKFLRAAPDFHMRYIQTVIARIYFCINRSWTGKISLSELRRSNLLAVLQVLSHEEDINQITDYFSYEHFYVIYCKFWNLDQDHDLLISKEDLSRHNDATISSRIIDRIFSGVVSKQIQKTGKMSYTDFVWFLIAEEDKKHPRSIEYWFRLMDIDGDGYISMYEMEYFYYEQVRRLELMNIEALPFLDSACQTLDLVNPKEKNKISLSDLKRTKMATIFFDTFINLEKYLEHESREFVSTRDIVQGGVVVSDWDRYASEEYENLVTEESSI